MPPSSAIGTNPRVGRATRMRARYHRGPAVSGTPDIAGRGPGWSWRIIVSIRRAYGLIGARARHPLSDRLVVGAVAVGGGRGVGRRLEGFDGGHRGRVVGDRTPRCDAGQGARRARRTRRRRHGAGVDVADGLVPRSVWRLPRVGPPRRRPPTVPVRDPCARLDRRSALRAVGTRSCTAACEWASGAVVNWYWCTAIGERSITNVGQRVAWQHVVGEFRLDWASDVDAGDPVARASNRVRAAIERGADELPGDDGALFRGLVVGDDRDQPPAMIQRFRASGSQSLDGSFRAERQLRARRRRAAPCGCCVPGAVGWSRSA